MAREIMGKNGFTYGRGSDMRWAARFTMAASSSARIPRCWVICPNASWKWVMCLPWNSSRDTSRGEVAIEDMVQLTENGGEFCISRKKNYGPCNFYERKDAVTYDWLSDESLRFGEELATVTLGIDALDRRLRNAQDEMDGLVVINMGWKKVAQFEDYAQAHAALAELAKKSFSLPEPDRRLYYLQACLSLTVSALSAKASSPS